MHLHTTYEEIPPPNDWTSLGGTYLLSPFLLLSAPKIDTALQFDLANLRCNADQTVCVADVVTPYRFTTRAKVVIKGVHRGFTAKVINFKPLFGEIITGADEEEINEKVLSRIKKHEQKVLRYWYYDICDKLLNRTDIRLFIHLWLKTSFRRTKKLEYIINNFNIIHSVARRSDLLTRWPQNVVNWLESGDPYIPISRDPNLLYMVKMLPYNILRWLRCMPHLPGGLAYIKRDGRGYKPTIHAERFIEEIVDTWKHYLLLRNR